MPAVNIFETLRQRVEGSAAHTDYEKRAIYWFQNQSAELTQWQTRYGQLRYDDVRHSTFTKKLTAAANSQIGKFYFFLYQPAGAKTLPHYDRFPFVLVLSRESTDSFLGLNFHYLSYQWRARLFDTLAHDYGIVSDKRPLASKINIDYDTLSTVSKYRAFRPCIHRYRTTQLLTPLLQVGSTDWDLALFLPVESFTNKTMKHVWRESDASINRKRQP